MDFIIEWMLDNNIAKNKWQAENIAKGLQLEGLDEQKQQVRCYCYREWRRAGENTGAAFEAAIELRDPPLRLFGLTDTYVEEA